MTVKQSIKKAVPPEGMSAADIINNLQGIGYSLPEIQREIRIMIEAGELVLGTNFKLFESTNRRTLLQG